MALGGISGITPEWKTKKIFSKKDQKKPIDIIDLYFNPNIITLNNTNNTKQHQQHQTPLKETNINRGLKVRHKQPPLTWD